jgi:carbonic anhydrase
MHRVFWVVLLSACAPLPAAKWSYGEPWTGTCASGREQSPIDVKGTGGFAPRVQFEYWPSSVVMTADGRGLRIDYEASSTLIIDEKHFALTHIEVHHPAEHLLDGKSFPIELQLHHQSLDKKHAAVAVLVREGAVNTWLQPLVTQLPALGERREVQAKINAAVLVSRKFLRYSGSLTSPPCSEGVTWLVGTTPIEMSAEQIAALAKILPDNHRPPQPANGRTVVEGEAR